ncbi:MAG: hypothetical protein AB1641_16980 [Thermodesulfobacteriota bacterium]
MYFLHDDPRLSAAWGPWFAHEYLNYFTALATPWLADLPPVPVRPCPGLETLGLNGWPLGPEHRDIYKEEYRLVRQVEGDEAYDYSYRNGEYATRVPEGTTIPPWQILVLYATEPDLMLDCDLELHWTQRFTGGSHGLRHMQFRAWGLNIGRAARSLHLHRQAARRAFELGYEYWGWRYLSRATHYLADLGHPFHVKVAPWTELVSFPWAAHRLFRRFSAIHQAYEMYAETRFRDGFVPFQEALVRGAQAGGDPDGPSLDAELRDYMARTAGSLDYIYRFLKNNFGPALEAVFTRMDEHPELDTAKQTMLCSADTVRVLFRPGGPDLAPLDQVTANILTEVGRMLGRLYAEEQNRLKSLLTPR